MARERPEAGAAPLWRDRGGLSARHARAEGRALRRPAVEPHRTPARSGRRRVAALARRHRRLRPCARHVCVRARRSGRLRARRTGRSPRAEASTLTTRARSTPSRTCWRCRAASRKASPGCTPRAGLDSQHGLRTRICGGIWRSSTSTCPTTSRRLAHPRSTSACRRGAGHGRRSSMRRRCFGGSISGASTLRPAGVRWPSLGAAPGRRPASVQRHPRHACVRAAGCRSNAEELITRTAHQRHAFARPVRDHPRRGPAGVHGADGVRRARLRGGRGALHDLRHLAKRCGGSQAQCDLLHLTLLESALRSGHTPMARSLVAERIASRPHSVFNQWVLAHVDRVSAMAARAPVPPVAGAVTQPQLLAADLRCRGAGNRTGGPECESLARTA